MKKNKKIDYIKIFILAVGIGFGIWFTKAFIIPRYFTELTDAQIATKSAQNYKEVEAVCGKYNVVRLCSSGTNRCSEAIGFTCSSWERTQHPEDFD